MPGDASGGSPATPDTATPAGPDAVDLSGRQPDEVARILADCPSRDVMWTTFLTGVRARAVAEIGVFRGRFAQHLLDTCPGIERYYLIDPWRHLEDWNKPANRADDVFEGYYDEVLRRTAAHEARRVVLRGRTVEVIEQIADDELDFAYIDGDHTLRGIATDLVRAYPKVRPGGWIGGDDFAASIWQHGPDFEPTFVFPFAVYFAEAVGARLYALGSNQFLLQKPTARSTEAGDFVDLAGKHPDVTVLAQLRQRRRAKRRRAAAGPDDAQADPGGPAPVHAAPEQPADRARGGWRKVADRLRGSRR